MALPRKTEAELLEQKINSVISTLTVPKLLLAFQNAANEPVLIHKRAELKNRIPNLDESNFIKNFLTFLQDHDHKSHVKSFKTRVLARLYGIDVNTNELAEKLTDLTEKQLSTQLRV